MFVGNKNDVGKQRRKVLLESGEQVRSLPDCARCDKDINCIPLTNRVRGPYRKLRTEVFPFRFMAQARSARAINRGGKTRIRNLQYGPRRRG